MHPKFCQKYVINVAYMLKIISLIKLQPVAWNFIKKETVAQVFSCEFCKIFKNNFSYRTPPVAAFVRF